MIIEYAWALFYATGKNIWLQILDGPMLYDILYTVIVLIAICSLLFYLFIASLKLITNTHLVNIPLLIIPVSYAYPWLTVTAIDIVPGSVTILVNSLANHDSQPQNLFFHIGFLSF